MTPHRDNDKTIGPSEFMSISEYHFFLNVDSSLGMADIFQRS